MMLTTVLMGLFNKISSVYKAKDKITNQIVALKKIKMDLDHEGVFS